MTTLITAAKEARGAIDVKVAGRSHSEIIHYSEEAARQKTIFAKHFE